MWEELRRAWRNGDGGSGCGKWEGVGEIFGRALHWRAAEGRSPTSPGPETPRASVQSLPLPCPSSRFFFSYLGRDAAHVEARPAERAAPFDASDLHAQLPSLNGGHVASRAAADDEEVLGSGKRAVSAREGCARRGRERKKNASARGALFVSLPSTRMPPRSRARPGPARRWWVRTRRRPAGRPGRRRGGTASCFGAWFFEVAGMKSFSSPLFRFIPRTKADARRAKNPALAHRISSTDCARPVAFLPRSRR